MTRSRSSGASTTSDQNTISRCNVINSAITSSWLKRCQFENCALSQVRDARWTTATKSQFHNVYAIKRSEISNSVIRDLSSVRRSTVKTSTIQETTTLERSTVTGCNISNSHVWRATLNDCEVVESEISRSDFTGMILKYGVWKRGQLVGRIGDKEPIAIKRDGTVVVSDYSKSLTVLCVLIDF